MRHRTQPSFWKAYGRLPQPVKRLADKNHDLLERDPFHPSLRFKKVRVGNTELWSVLIGKGYRALAYDIPEGMVWFWIGTHAEYDSHLA